MTKYNNLFPLEIFQAPSVTANSREVEKGGIFVALKGAKFDGNAYVNQAIEKGAAYIISESALQINKAIFIQVENAKEALNFLSHKIYREMPRNILAVTGTNGKTSIVNITRQLLIAMGKPAVSIGTLGIVGLGEKPIETGINTPPIDQLLKFLNKIAKEKIDYVVMEASSHGLHQERVLDIPFKAAAFTNLTQDHLDYHQSFENYFNAKMLLFNKYMQNGTAVVNCDIKEFEKISFICQQHNNKIISYGKAKGSDLRLKKSIITGSKQEVDFTYQGRLYQALIPLFGEYQAHNLLAAIGLLLALGFDINEIFKAIAFITEIPGRMELVADANDKFIFIDYSHSPDSLEKALETLIALKRKNLWLVFGCGGDRDKDKRPQMGDIATKLADYVIVTDDNPRQEDPQQIRNEILSRAKGAIEIGDRQQAIKYALDNMKPGDTLLIAGKGHEKYQVIGNNTVPFDEHKIILELISMAPGF